MYDFLFDVIVSDSNGMIHKCYIVQADEILRLINEEGVPPSHSNMVGQTGVSGFLFVFSALVILYHVATLDCIVRPTDTDMTVSFCLLFQVAHWGTLGLW